MTTIATSYLPNLNNFIAIARGGVTIEACESFQKHSNRNRAQIMTADGVKLLTVPLIGGRSVKLPITGVEVDYSTNFQRDHWRTVMTAYRSSPYWEHFEQSIEKLFTIKERYLFDLNCRITEELLNILKIETTLKFTTSYIGTSEPTQYSMPPYFQTFGDRQPFAPNLSILDWILCNGFLEI